MKTRAAVVPIAILFCRCFSPLLQSGTRMFRATGLPYPPLIPLRLLHSFSIAADLSISSHSLFLIILLLLLLLRLLSSSCVVHFALLSSRSVDLPGPPNQLFFLPVTVQISIPEHRETGGDVDPSYVRASVSHTWILKHNWICGYWALLYLNHRLKHYFLYKLHKLLFNSYL